MPAHIPKYSRLFRIKVQSIQAIQCIVLSSKGQLAVEYVVCMPVVLIVALIALNTGCYLGACALFDRSFAEAVRIHASAPAYGQDDRAICTALQHDLEYAQRGDNLSVSVESEATAGGLKRYSATLGYAPLITGPLRDYIMGVPMPYLDHVQSITIHQYRPGVML
jgi:hypothetical protein